MDESQKAKDREWTNAINSQSDSCISGEFGKCRLNNKCQETVCCATSLSNTSASRSSEGDDCCDGCCDGFFDALFE
jgi:hypothetical protein